MNEPDIRWHWYTFACQVRFRPDTIQPKTMKTMDKAAREAMLPDYKMFSVDLREGKMCLFDINGDSNGMHWDKTNEFNITKYFTLLQHVSHYYVLLLVTCSIM